MCWYPSAYPPPTGSKKCVCITRSNIAKNCEPAMNGVASTTRSEVVKFAQTRRGMRQNVIPGARIVMIVTRKLRAVMIDDAPAHWTPMLKNTCPSGWWLASGAYPVQPVAKGPPGTSIEPRSEEHTSELQSHSDLVCRL